MSLGKHCSLGALSALLLALACGGGGLTAPVAPNPSPARFGHVFLVVEENHSYSEVIGNSDMPYLNSLESQFGLATQYYANVHPSIGNYFMLTTGKMESLDDAFSGTVADDNIVRELVKAGKSWKCYAENLPSAGYTGADSYPYLKHHNPFAYLSDVVGSSQADNLVPFNEFSADLSSGTLPNFSFIVANVLNDAHDGTLAQADDWLKQHIDPLVSSTTFQNDGLLIIVFDESEMSDLSHGGGHVAAVIVSSKAKKGFLSSTLFQHQSTLRLILSSLGISKFPGASAAANDMSEFF
jgi:phosphatidylinositol-3-phosphatase